MLSSRADWVLGLARLISSPMTMFAKIGPGLNSNSRVPWLKTETPVMSLGSRSGVNWMRETEASTLRASDRASIVLPTPGTSSMSRCPSASSTVRASSTASRLPSMTVSIVERIERTLLPNASMVSTPEPVTSVGSRFICVPSTDGSLSGFS
jgi:hypothetical protein